VRALVANLQRHDAIQVAETRLGGLGCDAVEFAGFFPASFSVGFFGCSERNSLVWR
jgi:hypothetical protein